MKVELINYTGKEVKDYSPEAFLEFITRTCFGKSNINKQSNNSINYINGIIDKGHLGVLEHISFTFKIEDVSIALLKQLTRYRAGISFLVESQRYTNYNKNDIKYYVPETIRSSTEKLWDRNLSDWYKDCVWDSIDNYSILIEKGIPKEDARMILPQAICTNLVMTVNGRELRHIYEQRSSKHAQLEIRELMNKIRAELAEQKLEWVLYNIKTDKLVNTSGEVCKFAVSREDSDENGAGLPFDTTISVLNARKEFSKLKKDLKFDRSEDKDYCDNFINRVISKEKTEYTTNSNDHLLDAYRYLSAPKKEEINNTEAEKFKNSINKLFKNYCKEKNGNYTDQDSAFVDCVSNCLETYVAKNKDYSPMNILLTGQHGLSVRLIDKVCRLFSITERGSVDIRNESLEDNLKDVINYGIIGYLLLQNRWGKDFIVNKWSNIIFDKGGCV